MHLLTMAPRRSPSRLEPGTPPKRPPMPPIRTLALVASALSLALAGAARAQEAEPKPLWELGGVALGVSQQAYPGSSRQVHRGLALPFFIYRGPFLRADN